MRVQWKARRPAAIALTVTTVGARPPSSDMLQLCAKLNAVVRCSAGYIDAMLRGTMPARVR